eukprot:CCRYP_016703-RA/>CCRYP_016703-RA protein AED:0.02 eAED:0.02 QI:160/1/1/1/1/1/2/328/765
MLRSTPLSKMASTQSGMRRILKKRLPVPKYIELAVKAGTYKTPSLRPNYLGLHDTDSTAKMAHHLTARQREEQRVKLSRGILDYPEEYEILMLNPPLPVMPRTPVRVRRRIVADERKRKLAAKKERWKREVLGAIDGDDHHHGNNSNNNNYEQDALKELPGMDTLVKAYLKRYEDRVAADDVGGASRREQEYYSQLLLGKKSSSSSSSIDAKGEASRSSNTAMGRKSILIENAYAFALRQQQVLLQGDVRGMRESAARVEELLEMEARANRREGREITRQIQQWRNDGDDGKESSSHDNDKVDDHGTKDNGVSSSSIPSILHSKPRAIRALTLWSSRLRAIPYRQWTVGATTALDHWIAREVLGMDENTWALILEGGGADVSKLNVLTGGESRRGLVDRMRDLVVAREALFPETTAAADDGDDDARGELAGDLEQDETNKSIDALLASLGSFDDDDDVDGEWKFDEVNAVKEQETDEDAGEKEPIETIMDELQVWRERNASSSYDKWDRDRKEEFDLWIEKYVSTLSPESTDKDQIDLEATRAALLSEPPIDSARSKDFWTKVRTETEAEIFLRDYRLHAEEKLRAFSSSSSTLTEEEKNLQSELQILLSIPLDRQLRKLVDMGTIRPILDEYTQNSDRQQFFEKYSTIFLEGLELEHLVPDPDGPIQLEDVGPTLREELSRSFSPTDLGVFASDQEPRFAIRKIAYGTDEFGTPRAQRARDLYRLWNEHKANRAKFEEAMFKKGFLGLKETRMGQKKKKGGDKK